MKVSTETTKTVRGKDRQRIKIAFVREWPLEAEECTVFFCVKCIVLGESSMDGNQESPMFPTNPGNVKPAWQELERGGGGGGITGIK